ncbi:hemicentin-1-like [Oratosquilla oratoria]|uniref:hemicentin-1-like n=1 Tax=Oratosquilla oratoria TaxID=337810 RepID=UPI003F76FB94
MTFTTTTTTSTTTSSFSLLLVVGLCLTGIPVARAFAPSIDLPTTTTQPTTTTPDAATLPFFLNHENSTNVTVKAGEVATLDCQVFRLGEKTVSWVRRRGVDIHLLTFGFVTYHSDSRYSLQLSKPNNWKLQIQYVQLRDQGEYECQVSSHPPLIRKVFLKVTVPDIDIRDSRGTLIREKFYEVGSRIDLHCNVTPAPPTNEPLTWSLDEQILTSQSEDKLSIETSIDERSISSWVHIASSDVGDTGQYTCRIGDIVEASVRVHVLDGESSAAMQHSTNTASSPSTITSSSTTTTTIISSFIWITITASLIGLSR